MMTNLEEIKAIADILMSIGAEAKSAFIWWLVFDKLLPVFAWLISLGAGLVFAFYAIRTTPRLTQLRDAMGVGSPGTLLDSEYLQMLKWIRDHK